MFLTGSLHIVKCAKNGEFSRTLGLSAQLYNTWVGQHKDDLTFWGHTKE